MTLLKTNPLKLNVSRESDIKNLVRRFPQLKLATIERVYDQEVAKLLKDARIIIYVPILVLSAARNRLSEIAKNGTQGVEAEPIQK